MANGIWLRTPVTSTFIDFALCLRLPWLVWCIKVWIESPNSCLTNLVILLHHVVTKNTDRCGLWGCQTHPSSIQQLTNPLSNMFVARKTISSDINEINIKLQFWIICLTIKPYNINDFWKVNTYLYVIRKLTYNFFKEFFWSINCSTISPCIHLKIRSRCVAFHK